LYSTNIIENHEKQKTKKKQNEKDSTFYLEGLVLFI